MTLDKERNLAELNKQLKIRMKLNEIRNREKSYSIT